MKKSIKDFKTIKGTKVLDQKGLNSINGGRKIAEVLTITPPPDHIIVIGPGEDSDTTPLIGG